MALAGLSDKVVVVTGGGSGIGRAVVDRLLDEGSSVALVDVDESAVDRTAEELGEERLLGIVADVSTEEGTDRYFSAALGRFGRVDGLHANAGVVEPGKTLAETAPGDFDRTVAVNLRGVFLAIRAMLRALEAQGTRGSLVTTSSVLGLTGLAGSGAYCASKAGVISLTRTAAIEAGPAGHRVNAILPGPIATPLAERIEQSLPEDERAAHRARFLDPVPLGRFGEAPEVASLAAWLLSDESSYVTGGIYSVDGGQSAG